MKNAFFGTVSFLFLFLIGISPMLVRAQSSGPILLVSPSNTIQAGVTNPVIISLVNMGVPLKRVEVTIRLSGDKDPAWGIAFQKKDIKQYGLEYKSHYAASVDGRSDIQDLTIVFEAVQPQGYNQGSAQIPVAEVTYLAVPGTFSAMIVPEKTKLTDADGNLLPSIQSYGASNYLAQTNPVSQDLQSYSLSFESDPIKKWWPTAPNTVQQIEAAVWKDSDGDSVKNFKNLYAEWQVDSSYLEIKNTSSSYFPQCPLPTISSRPCIRFVAHAVTKKPGLSSISLTVTDMISGRQSMNQYPLEIYPIENTPPNPVATPIGSQSASAMPSFIPESKVTDKEFKEIQQKVTYMQSQINQQQQQINQTQSLVGRVVEFLRRIFRFN